VIRRNGDSSETDVWRTFPPEGKNNSVKIAGAITHNSIGSAQRNSIDALTKSNLVAGGTVMNLSRANSGHTPVSNQYVTRTMAEQYKTRAGNLKKFDKALILSRPSDQNSL
jgi:hypothetical protein